MPRPRCAPRTRRQLVAGRRDVLSRKVPAAITRRTDGCSRSALAGLEPPTGPRRRGRLLTTRCRGGPTGSRCSSRRPPTHPADPSASCARCALERDPTVRRGSTQSWTGSGATSPKAAHLRRPSGSASRAGTPWRGTRAHRGPPRPSSCPTRRAGHAVAARWATRRRGARQGSRRARERRGSAPPAAPARVPGRSAGGPRDRLVPLLATHQRRAGRASPRRGGAAWRWQAREGPDAAAAAFRTTHSARRNGCRRRRDR